MDSSFPPINRALPLTNEKFRPEKPLPFPGLSIRVPRPDTYVDFTSNDYLALTSNAELRSQFIQKLATQEHILGSRSVRLLDGNTTAHVGLERRLRMFYNVDEALLFNSGYDANLSIFSSLPEKGDVIVFDEYIHASARDGICLSRASASAFPFQHNSSASLHAVLEQLIEAKPDITTGKAHVFVAVETLYSMGGDFCSLQEVIEVCEALLPAKSRHLIVDEAHTTGCFGLSGRGVISMLGLEDKFDIRVHTFSKALANMGAVVLCKTPIYNHLLQFSRPLMFSTSLNLCTLAAIDCTFDILESDAGTRLIEKLHDIASYATKSIASVVSLAPPGRLSLAKQTRLQNMVSPIIALFTPYLDQLTALLRERGYNANPISYPVVPAGRGCIRLCIHSSNTVEEVNELVSILSKWLTREGVWEKDFYPPVKKARAISFL